MKLRVKELRKRLGLTQIDLAEKAGVRQATISELESGAANSTLVIVEKVAIALEVTIADLFETSDRLPVDAELVRKFSQLPQEQQLLLVKTADAILATKAP